ncbi:hypothetical protein ACW9QD_002712 [Acinetobacter baumannii]
MIDPSIITRGAEQAQLQQQQNMEMLGNLGGALGQMVLGRRINQMRQLGTPDEQKAFANNSIFSPQLNQVLQGDQATAQKNLLDQQKTLAEVGKIAAETGKIGSETGITLQNNAGSVWGAFLNGGAGAAKAQLENLKNRGLIDPISYQSEADALANLPLGAKDQFDYARGRFAGIQDPKFTLQSKDNEADNAASVANNIRTTNATMRGQDITADTAEKNRIQQDKQFQKNFEYQAQQDELKNGQGELKEYGGKVYLVYKNGDFRPAIGADGQQIMAQPKETQLQVIKRKESAQNHVSASAQAASGATLAANIANRYVQGGYNPAKFALESKIPGTEAYGIAKDLESLKSNAFLSRADQMRGLGALTETEGARLISSVSPLDPMQSSEKFLSDLKNVAGTFSDIAKSNRDKAQLYANPNGNIATSTVAPAKSTEQNVTIPKGAYMTLSDVKASAKNTGISVEDAIQRLQSKGVTIR